MKDTLGLSGREGGSACGCIKLIKKFIYEKNLPATCTVMVRGPSCELSPSHSTIVPSTMEASDSEVRVAVRGPLESVRTPRNAGSPPVSLILVLGIKLILNNSIRPCGAAIAANTVHRMRLPGRVQVKVTVSSGQATVDGDVVSEAAKHVNLG